MTTNNITDAESRANERLDDINTAVSNLEKIGQIVQLIFETGVQEAGIRKLGDHTESLWHQIDFMRLTLEREAAEIQSAVDELFELHRAAVVHVARARA